MMCKTGKCAVGSQVGSFICHLILYSFVTDSEHFTLKRFAYNITCIFTELDYAINNG